MQHSPERLKDYNIDLKYRMLAVTWEWLFVRRAVLIDTLMTSATFARGRWRLFVYV